MIEIACFARVISEPESKESRGKKTYVSFLAAADSTNEDGAETSLVIKVLAFGESVEEALALRLEDRVAIEGDCSIGVWHTKGVAKPSVTIRARHLRRPRIGEHREPPKPPSAEFVAAALARPTVAELPAFMLRKVNITDEENGACQQEG